MDPLDLVERVSTDSGLTHSQMPIWLGQARHPESPLYNMAFTFVLEGAIDVHRFCAAWRSVAEESDALCTAIEPRGSIGIRVVRRRASETTVLDFSDRADPKCAFRAWARERCARPFPLDRTLVESALVRLGAERWGWYLNQHHLVTDAWSTVLLFRHVSRAYRDRGSVADLAEAPPRLTPYYATARALGSFPDVRARGEARRHWADRDGRGDRKVPLYGRPTRVASTRSERVTRVLSAEQSQRVSALAATPEFLGFTPHISSFAVFAGVLAAWLSRVSSRSQVGFDTPSVNRPTLAARQSIGVFIEMFPFDVQLEPAFTFRELVRTCLAETRQLLKFALPGTRVPGSDGGGNVVLNFFSPPEDDFAGLSASSDWVHSGESDSVHALRLHVEHSTTAGRYTLHFDLNEEAFPGALRTRAVAHFERLLAAMLENPDQRVAAVDVLSDEEREALLVRFNETGSAPLPSETVVARIERQSAHTPGEVALRDRTRALTFAQLRQQMHTVAAGLLRRGVSRGDAVGVLAPRSADAVIALLGVLRAGAHYVPLGRTYPAERIRDVLTDSGAVRVLLAGDLPGDGLPDSATPIRLDDLLHESPAECPLAGPRLGDLAYNLYTSGSTGRPKGVLVEHGGLADYLEWAERTYVRGDRLTYPLFTSLAFDLTVTSLYLPLVTGGTLLVYEEAAGPADTSILDVLRDDAADFLKLTPSHLALAVRSEAAATRIRRVVVGGEDFKTHLAAAAAARFGDAVEIYNEYGPTEAVVGCMVHRYDPTEPGRSVPIGRPADHVDVYLLGQALQPVPEGVPGELCVSRHGLARGYHRRDEATRSAFVPHPFRSGERLYRTGDLARFVRPGVVEYLGRVDRQLKISGMRVEPGEIEAALLSHDAIQQCVVTAQPGIGQPAPAALRTAHCERCGLASTYPGLTLDGDGVCSVCRSFAEVREHAASYFGSLEDLRAIVAAAAPRRRGPYDLMLLLSGGKDSTYALCRLVELGFKVYAFSFDNGYISESAKANIRRIVEALGVDHEFGSTPAMRAIFRDSLMRFSNVCNGCFKTIYTLGITRAHHLGIPVVVTGLTRGQLFETRLSADLFADGRRTPAEIDAAVLEARKAYHRSADEVTRSLDVALFQDDRLFDEIQVVDFYRYCDAGLTEILTYLQRRVPWIRPLDTGRSTNCLINDVGIYIHQRERGYHNYGLPYSWDVRMGQKTRDQALEELHDRLDMPRVRRILSEIGYDENRLSNADATRGLVAYYVASHEIRESDLRSHLAAQLPLSFLPGRFVRLDALPLTPNGKVDEAALRPPAVAEDAVPKSEAAFLGPVQERIAAIWRDVLGTAPRDPHTSLFALGGTSIAAMEIALRICEAFEVHLPLQVVFTHATVAQLAERVESRIVEEVAALSEKTAQRLAAGLEADA